MKKHIIRGMILLVIIGLFLQSCFAAENLPETIITYISVNDAVYYDIEVLMTKKGEIFLPFKQLSELFEIPVSLNHSTKNISFKSITGKTGSINKNGIYIDGKCISDKKNYYIKQGLMSDVKDEIFAHPEDLSKIFDAKIIVDKENLSVSTTVNRKLAAIPETTEITDSNQPEPKFKAYTEVAAPQMKGKVTLDSIGLSNNMTSDSTQMFLLNEKTSNLLVNNNTQFLLRGKAYGGEYSADLSTYNYKGELFSFGGLGFNYKNKYKNWNYEIGRINGFKDEKYSIGIQTFGAQISNYAPEKNYREINGYVDKGSLVKVYINGEYNTTLNTYDGYYSLNELFICKEIKNLKLEELKADGTTKILLEKIYPKNSEIPGAKEKRYSAITGISGFNNRLFNQNGYIYEMNTKKFLLGGEYKYGINDKLNYNAKLLADKIVYQPKNSLWQSIYNNSALLNSGTFKNPNVLEGVTALNTLNYLYNDNWDFKTTLGTSGSRDVNLNEIQAGYALNLESNYKKDFYELNANVYNTSPDFYLAGSDGSFVSDRLGAGIGGNINLKNLSANGHYNKYFSNLNQKYEGGLINFNEYSLFLSTRLKEFANVRFNINRRDGENVLAKNSNYYYDLNISRQLSDRLNAEIGKTESCYEFQPFSTGSDISNFSSKYSNIYVRTNYRLPKNLGTIHLGNEAVNYETENLSNDYKMAKIGYTFPEFKRITLTLGTGYKYAGTGGGFDFGANLAYRCKSGRVINVNYQYTQNGGYFFDNIYLPTSCRHSINLVLNDAFVVLPSGLKSVGYDDARKGFVEVITYIDKNKNGKYDRKDVKVRNVPVRCSWVQDAIYTDKKGRAIPASAEQGIYKVGVDGNKLAGLLSQPKLTPETQIVRVDARKITRVEFPLISSAGNISGKLKIADDFGRELNIREFIVVLLDEDKKEVAYSTVDDEGNFNMSGVSPGKYTVKLDDSFIEANNLMTVENKSEINVDIPYEYEKFVDVENIELIYSSMSI